MARKTPAAPAAPVEEPSTRILVRPIDVTAKGSAAEWRDLMAVQTRLLRARQALNGEEGPFLEYLDAVAARDAAVKARAYTSGNLSLDEAWNELSQVELNTLYHELLVGGSTVVPPASGPS